MSIYSDRINRLARMFNARTYLEIGVFAGETFLNVNIPHRSAVDPRFRFDPGQHQAPDTFYFDMPSDAYFDNMDKIRRRIYNADLKFDIILLDGLHTYEQTLRDFTNSFSVSHENTIWILDDTVPSDPWSTVPDMGLCYRYRQMAGINSNAWHGDVFKCVFALHDFYPDFSYATVVDNGNPQTIVWRHRGNVVRKRICDSWHEIAGLSYFDMLANCNYFNLCRDADLAGLIGKPIEDSRADAGELSRFIVGRLPAMQS